MSVGAHFSLAGDAEGPRIRTLYRLPAALSRASELEDAYEAAIASLVEATAADRAAILLFDEHGVMRKNLPEQSATPPYRIPENSPRIAKVDTGRWRYRWRYNGRREGWYGARRHN